MGGVNRTFADVVDVIDNSATKSLVGNTGSTNWKEVDLEGSTAKYKLRTMGLDNKSVAARWNANGYFYTTTSGGVVKSIKIVANSKSVTIYGSTGSAFTVNSNKIQSGGDTGVTQVTTGTATETGLTYAFPANTEYTLVGVQGGAKSTEITSIEITWSTGTVEVIEPTVELAKSELAIGQNTTVIYPEELTDMSIVANNAEVATYTDGTIKALKAGTATFTATWSAVEGAYKNESSPKVLTLIVTKKTPTLKFADSSKALFTGGSTYTNTLTKTPVSATGIFTISATPSACATIDSETGEVTTGNVAGTATVTFTSDETDEYQSGTASYDLTITEPIEGTVYELVTDASTLKEGDEIIITNIEATKALSTTQGTNNRSAVDITANDDGTITPADNVALITLGGSAGAWTLNTTNGDNQGYLYTNSTSGSNGNRLFTASSIPGSNNAYYYASISITDNTATITYGPNETTKKPLQYNSSSNLFACYSAASMKNVRIYRKAAATSTTLYIKADYAPWVYTWKGDVKFTGEWPSGSKQPGTQTTSTETKYGIEWKTITVPSRDFNLILADGYNQTGNIENLTDDTYLVYNSAADGVGNYQYYIVDPTEELVSAEDMELSAGNTLAATVTNSHSLALSYDSSDTTVATVSADGEVTGVAKGTADITISWTTQGTMNGTGYLAGSTTFAVTVVPGDDNTTYVYRKITSTDDLTDGQYLIVYEADAYALNGKLASLDVVNNGVDVSLAATTITGAYGNSEFTITTTAGVYTVMNEAGLKIGHSGSNNTLDTGELTNTISFDENGNAVFTASDNYTLQFNKAANQRRFRFYKNQGQEPVALYKKDTGATFETLTMNNRGWTTYVAPVKIDAYATTTDYTDGEDQLVKFYKVDAFDNTQVSMIQLGNTEDASDAERYIPAGTAIIVEAPASTTVALTVTSADASMQDNLLKPGTGAYPTGTGPFYVLQWNNDLDKAAFFRLTVDRAVPTDKAYLDAADRSTSALQLSPGHLVMAIDGAGETTGISSELNQQSAGTVGAVYTLDGRKVTTNGDNLSSDNLPKGIYIVNGRKVVIK